MLADITDHGFEYSLSFPSLAIDKSSLKSFLTTFGPAHCHHPAGI
jgi:hypothetical protein